MEKFEEEHEQHYRAVRDGKLVYDFDEGFAEWSRVPVDDLGYFNADELLVMSNLQLFELAKMATVIRFREDSWRNRDAKLSEFMNLKDVEGRRVIDFGCGLGLDTVQFAHYGADVMPADLHPLLVYTAQKVLALVTGFRCSRCIIVRPDYPYFVQPVDLFWSLGVLHHTPFAASILRSACEQLLPGGECRVGLYSDRRWVKMMDEPPPEGPTWKHPRFDEWVRKNDTVGYYADWYDEAKVARLVEDFGYVDSCRYICDDNLIGVVVKPK